MMTGRFQRLVGVVLAAGVGSRLGPMGEKHVKALLPVANEPLIGHHLKLLRGLGVKRVVVVVGHQAKHVKRALGDGSRWGLKVELVTQSKPLGSAHALAAARPYVTGPFLLLLGDYYFVAREPEAMLQRLERGESAIAVKREPNERLVREACAVSTRADGKVVGIVEKPAQPATDLKGCGFYALQPEAFDVVMRTPRTVLRDEYELTVTLELLVARGMPLFGEEIIEWDNNVTRPEDLLRCNLDWLDRHRKQCLVADGAEVDVRTRIERAVIGAGAVLRGDNSLREVVVFPGVQLVDQGVIKRTLVTPGSKVLCGKAAVSVKKGAEA